MQRRDIHATRRELSRRQKEVVLLSLTGKTAKRIAEDLGLSVHTVRDHFQLIYKKLGIRGREELMAMFIRKQTQDRFAEDLGPKIR
jgi:DNA-binding CsgD family transcriptional regulator